ncbi:alpha/beta hydrolase family protein [Pseudoalteromonas sp. GB56]
MTTNFTVKTEDNVTLNGIVYPSEAAKAVILINPGTATRTSFYTPFAQFLAEHGYHVVLWNYRGFAESKTSPLSECNYSYSDIGRYDIPAVIDKTKRLFPQLPLYCIGHSAGGQQFGLAHNHTKVDALIAVAVSAGYFAHMPLAYRLKANFFFRIYAPITAAIFNYVPAKKFNFMEDLPTGFAKEWSAWCKEKNLFFAKKFYGKSVPDGTYQNFSVPTYVFTADDDEISTPRNVDNFWQQVSPKQPIKFKYYNSSLSPSGKIGHFGYFRKSNKQIWIDILTKLDELCNG